MVLKMTILWKVLTDIYISYFGILYITTRSHIILLLDVLHSYENFKLGEFAKSDDARVITAKAERQKLARFFAFKPLYGMWSAYNLVNLNAVPLIIIKLYIIINTRAGKCCYNTTTAVQPRTDFLLDLTVEYLFPR